MKVIISQQGSGTRIYSAHYFGDVLPEPFAVEPAPTEEWAEEYLKDKPDFRLMYRHLQEQPWLYDLLIDYEIIHLYRDPARTFIRDMCKYDLTVTKKDLKNHVDTVEKSREKINSTFTNVTIVHYEDFIRDLYLGEIKELNHL